MRIPHRSLSRHPRRQIRNRPVGDAPRGSSRDGPEGNGARRIPGEKSPSALFGFFLLVEVIFDDAAGLFRLRFAHEDFDARKIGREDARGERVDGSERWRSDAGAFEQPTKHHRLGPGAGAVDHDCLFTTVFRSHLSPLSAAPIIV